MTGDLADEMLGLVGTEQNGGGQLPVGEPQGAGVQGDQVEDLHE